MAVGASFDGGGEDIGGIGEDGGAGRDDGPSFGGVEGFAMEGVVGGIAEESEQGGEFRDLLVVEDGPAEADDAGLPLAGRDEFFLGGTVGHGGGAGDGEEGDFIVVRHGLGHGHEEAGGEEEGTAGGGFGVLVPVVGLHGAEHFLNGFLAAVGAVPG